MSFKFFSPKKRRGITELLSGGALAATLPVLNVLADQGVDVMLQSTELNTVMACLFGVLIRFLTKRFM